MTFNADVQCRISFQNFNYYIEFRIRYFLNNVFARHVVDALSSNIYFLNYILFNFRTAIVGGFTRCRRTFVFFIVNTIAISIWDGAAIVFGGTCSLRTFIFFVVDAIAIGIRNRAAIVFGNTWYINAFVVFVGNAVFVLIGATSQG